MGEGGSHPQDRDVAGAGTEPHLGGAEDDGGHPAEQVPPLLQDERVGEGQLVLGGADDGRSPLGLDLAGRHDQDVAA